VKFRQGALTALTTRSHPISTVERDTGIARDTLRIWERRYGFPNPERDERGNRVYPESQIRRLQLIRRLMDQGWRPGKIVGLDEAALDRLSAGTAKVEQVAEGILREVLETVSANDVQALNALLRSNLERIGVRRLILEVLAPAARLVGERWVAGQIEIYEEHLFTRVVTRLLDTLLTRHEPATLEEPAILLATLPGEPHGLGLLMVDVLLHESGLATVNLGTEVPLEQVVQAVTQVNAGTVGLSFSSSYPYGQIRKDLLELRSRIPSDTAIWIGGGGAQRLKRFPPGVIRKELEQL